MEPTSGERVPRKCVQYIAKSMSPEAWHRHSYKRGAYVILTCGGNYYGLTSLEAQDESSIPCWSPERLVDINRNGKLATNTGDLHVIDLSADDN